MGLFSKPTQTKKRSDKHEKAVSKTFGGRLTRGSGNQHDKGDVVTDKFRIECKTTKNQSYRLDQVVLEKIMGEASAAGETGLLNVQFEVTDRRYIVIEERDFQWLMEKVNGRNSTP